MSNNYKSKVLSKAKQNRTNRVVRESKEYDKKVSKSQQAYVAGDLISSASKKAFAYKEYGTPKQSWITGGRSRYNYQKLQEGKNPYEGKYYYDGKPRTVKNDDGSTFTSRKRFLTDDEKESLKYTGDINVSDYKKNYKYSILRGVDSDGKTFKSNLNTFDKDGKFKWDGMNVAKNKVKAGGSKFNYLGGFLKDTVLDPGVDFLKQFDRYESGALGAGLGLAETVKDGVDSITSGDLSFKNVDWSRMKKNWDESFDEANKTGWGHSAMHYLKEMSNRSDDKMYNYLLETKGKEAADKYRESEQKVQGVENVANTVLGLGLDFMNPAQIGTAFAKTFGKLGKNAVSSGKALLNGTSDLSVGFKNSNNVLDILTGHTGKTSGTLDRVLNNDYERVMSKADDVKQVLKQNPETKNLGSFLDEIGENVLKGKQRNIDGRTLNKKYTQVKGDYVPQLMRNTDEVVEDVSKNVDNAQINFGQYNNSNINNYFKDLRQTDEGVYIASELKYASDTGDYSNLIKSLDDVDPKVADRVLDWLEEYEPNVFNKHFGNVADEFDEFANQGIQVNRLADKRDSMLVNNVNKNSRKIVEKPKYDYSKTNNAKEENAIEKIANTLDEKVPKRFKDSIERKDVFENSIRNLSKDMFEGKVDGDDIIKSIKEVKGNSVPTNIKREYINNKLFGGDEVIASNVGSKSIDGLLDSVEDLANLKKVVNHYMKTGEVLSVKLSESTKEFLKVGDDLKVVGSKVRGYEMRNPEELIETLNKSIVDRARALTDERYGDKLQLMARELGYDNYQTEILDTIEKLRTQRKTLDKIPNKTAEIMDKQRNLSERIRKLTNVKNTRDDMWKHLKNLPEKDFDKLVAEQYPHHMKNMKSYSTKANQRIEINNISKVSDETSKVIDKYDFKQVEKMISDVFKENEYIQKLVDEGADFDELVKRQTLSEYISLLKKRDTPVNLGIEDVKKMELEKALEEGFGANRKTFNDVAPEVKEKSLEVAINKKDKEFGLDNESLKKANEFKRSIKESERLNKYYQELGEFAKEIGVTVPKKTQAKVKLAKNQTLGSLPPVKENLEGLKKLIKKEVEEMYTNPKAYEESKDFYTSLKKEYINGLRSYGIPDNKYFEKAKNLKETFIKELEKQGYKLPTKEVEVKSPLDLVRQTERDELLKPINAGPKDGSGFVDMKDVHANKIKKAKEGGSGTPKNGMNMNLQLLARKIDEMFDELGNTSIEKLSDEWQTLTDRKINSIESLQRRSHKATKNVDVSNHTPYDYDEFAGGEDVLGDFWKNINNKEKPLDKVVKETSDDFNPFASIKGGVDDISDVTPEVKKVRKKKTQAEIDEIDKKLKSFEERQNSTTPLEKIGDNRRLPRVSELMEQGILKDEAFEIIEKMKKGEIDLPSFNTVKKADRQGGFNTTTEIDADELGKIVDNLRSGVSKPVETIKNSTPKKNPSSNVKYGQHNVNKSIPEGYIVNESTGEVVRATDYLMKNKFEPISDVYDVAEDVAKPLEKIAKKITKSRKKPIKVKEEKVVEKLPKKRKVKTTPKTNSTNSIKYGQHNVNKSIPKGYTLNESTGELEKLTDHLLSNKIKPDSTVYDVEEVSTPLEKAVVKFFKPGEGKRKIKLPESIKEGKEIKNPKYKVVNETTGEVEDLTKHLFGRNSNPDPNVYDIDEFINTPLEEISPQTFKPGEGKRKIINNNKHSFEKEGKDIEVPKHIFVNEKTGEVEDLSKYILGRGNTKPSADEIDEIIKRYEGSGNGRVYDNVDDFVNYRNKVDEGKFVTPTFDEFKRFFTEKSNNTQIGYEEDGIYKAYKAWLNSYKKGLTIYNPGWHVANFLQNKGQNYLALGTDAFGSQKNARKVLAHINGKDKGALELVSKNGTKYTKDELAKLAKDLGVAEGLGTNTSKSHGVFPWLETKIDNSYPMQRALQSEQTARLHHFLTQLERGKTPEQAVKSVNDYLFDYGSKSKADKLMSDFVDPFWSFHKSNAKMLTQAPFKNTSNVNNVLRVNRDLKGMVDDENKNSPMYREHQLPFGSFKDELNGDDYNYLYDENVLPDVDKAIPLERDEIETKLNPLIRIALQQKRGEGEFGNKIVDKDESDWGEVTKEERLGEIGLELNPVLNSFFKKFEKTANHQKKTDEGKQTQETTNKQILNEWLAYIFGNKGNYYRNLK